MTYKTIKRVLDILLSSSLLVLLTPVYALVAISLIEKDETLLFKQQRVGLNGRVFNIYKFRTIKHVNGEELTSKYCQFLRKYGIDELPQLVNVLKGDMSLIGPRPRSIEYYENCSKSQKRVYSVLPGILHPVICKEKEKSTITDKLETELSYVDHLSLKEDLSLIGLFIINSRKIFEHRQGICSNKDNIKRELQELKNQQSIEIPKQNNKRLIKKPIIYRSFTSSKEKVYFKAKRLKY